MDKDIAFELGFKLEKWVSKSFYVKDLEEVKNSN